MNEYQVNKDRYLKQFARLFRSARKVLPNFVTTVECEDVVAATKRGLEAVLADLPPIGGEANPFLLDFVSGGLALAYARVLEGSGLPLPAIGESLYQIYSDVFESLPRPVKWWLRRQTFTAGHKERLKTYAAVSQRREYPANWVLTYVEGEDGAFDYGCNYSECAVLKLFRSQGAERYMPYVCIGDFAVSRALCTGLTRTGALLYGAPYCDFRFKRGAVAQAGLPIEALPEYRPKAEPAASRV